MDTQCKAPSSNQLDRIDNTLNNEIGNINELASQIREVYASLYGNKPPEACGNSKAEVVEAPVGKINIIEDKSMTLQESSRTAVPV